MSNGREDLIKFLKQKYKSARTSKNKVLLSQLILEAERPIDIIRAEARGRIEGREETVEVIDQLQSENERYRKVLIELLQDIGKFGLEILNNRR